MNEDLVSTIQTISALLSTILAVVALYVAFRAERRGHTRFIQELELAERVAASQIRPLISIYGQNFKFKKSLVLINRGVGSAVISQILFSKNGFQSKDVGDMFHFPDYFTWERQRVMPKGSLFLAPVESILLVRIMEDYLFSNGVAPELSENIMNSWHDQKTGIKVNIEYEDALGNKQPSYSDTLR